MEIPSNLSGFLFHNPYDSPGTFSFPFSFCGGGWVMDTRASVAQDALDGTPCVGEDDLKPLSLLSLPLER